MKLLLFGGTFDPPHIGHISLLKNAIAAVRPDRVLVIPANIPPHKQASATPGNVRRAMCACFVPLHPALEVSDIELRRKGKSYTLLTVQELLALYPGADMYMCIGSDMLLSFTGWYRYRELLQTVTLVVQNRLHEDEALSYKAAEVLRNEGAKILFASGEVEEISSSGLRAALAAGENVWAQIPSPASDIARRLRLYAPPEKGPVQ